MYSLNSFLLIGFIGAIVWFWYESLRVREYVVRICRQLCERSELQLLDQTVALSSLSPSGSLLSRWQLRRIYQFEVSNNGSDRYKGYITLLGASIENIHVDNPDGMTTIYPAVPDQLH